MTSETTSPEQPFVRPNIEIDTQTLQAILQPDDALAIQALDRTIEVAELNPKTDPETMELLRFQRSLLDMSPLHANSAAENFALKKGKYATFTHTFGHSRPGIHYEINRSLLVHDYANQERWRLVGVDPEGLDGSPISRTYKNLVEESWSRAREARGQLETARANETYAMEAVRHLAGTAIHGKENESTFVKGIARGDIKDLNLSRYPSSSIHHMYGEMEYYSRGIIFEDEQVAAAVDALTAGVSLHFALPEGLQLSRVEACAVKGLEGTYPGMFFRSHSLSQDELVEGSRLFVKVVNEQLEILGSRYQIPE